MAEITNINDVLSQELTADDIYGAEDIKPIPRKVSHWTKNNAPGVIYFKPLSADRVITFRKRMNASEDAKVSAFVDMFAECACDSKGNLLFGTPASVEKLKQKSGTVFLQHQDFLMKLNGMVPPTKTLDAVVSILESSGVPSEVVAQVKAKWKADDDDTLKN